MQSSPFFWNIYFRKATEKLLPLDSPGSVTFAFVHTFPGSATEPAAVIIKIDVLEM
jgi:hypothetical protein